MTETLVAFAVLSVLLQKVIERVRKRLPRLDGDLVTLASAVVGVGLAWGLDLRVGAEVLQAETLPLYIDYLVTGLSMAGLSGVLADVIKSRKPS